MKSIFLISWKEIKQRVMNRSFVLSLILGPIFIMICIYFLVKAADEGKKNVHVLIADPGDILQGVISSKEDPNVRYSFVSDYLEIDEFAQGKPYQKFDALLEVNEKVLNNKKVFIFHRDYFSNRVQNSIRFTIERRIEEVLIEEFSDLTVDAFRQLKQPLNLDFRSILNPTNSNEGEARWVGYFFGSIIILFTLFYGMSILRGVAREKADRVVEVMVSIVSPTQLMIGKIIGVGVAALIQLVFSLVLILFGLYLFKELLFSDFFLDHSVSGAQVSEGANELLQHEFQRVRNNEVIHLLYDRINLTFMLPFFFLFFVISYVFYGAFFSLIGAAMGSEGDGQVLILPLVLLLLFSLFAGYFMVLNPSSQFSSLCQYIPFTAPMAVMVKLAMGYASGEGYLLWISFLILLLSSFLILWIAGKVFKSSLLSFGQRLSLKSLYRWRTKK
tara:strand:- start:4617 stop:5948 length:1332 start_codon:yes stop_codon:yes gene_type:complete